MKTKIKPGTVIFIIFVLLIFAYMFYLCEQSVRNADAVLQKTQYVDEIGGWK